MEFILIGVILLFVYMYRINKGENVYKFISSQFGLAYEKYAPYSFKVMRKKVKELGQEYTVKQYTIQVIIFALIASIVGYLYNYNLIITIVYVVVAVAIIPYITYLRCKRIYSEFIFEQIQVYTSNIIMEFQTTNSFVKALEEVASSGILEDPILSDVKTMINLAYENGNINQSIKFMNEKYPYFVVKNLHQLFLQVTKEGAKDTKETFENMLDDIDMLVESVYRDRIDRRSFHKQFLQYGIMLYAIIILIQLMLGVDSYIFMLDNILVRILVNLVIIINSYFLLNCEKYYNENVGAE